MAEIKTRAERLNEILIKALPHMKEVIPSGKWGPEGAPYVFSTLESGQRKLVILDERTGDRYGAIGNSMDDVLDKMAARFEK